MQFDELALPEPLLRAIEDLGWTEATPIQAQALPILLAGRDIAGQAQTGTGKTACFLLGLLKQLMESERPEDGSPRGLVIAPTRELAIQIAEDAVKLTKYVDIDVTICCGGLSWTKQRNQLDAGTDLVVGTPGRLLDYESRRILKLKSVEVAVVDEADRMYDMGFIADINHLFRYMPRKADRQAMLFSATLSDMIMRLARRHLHDPAEVKIEPDRLVVENIEQSLYHVGNHEKVNLLMGLINREQPTQAMIFVNRKVDGEHLTWRLNQNGYEAVYLSGDLPQRTRLKIIEGMKAGKIHLLVATDVASRGIHVDEVTHVFNWDVPQDPEDYVHRIGRTARAGRKGKAITLACEETVMSLAAVETLLERKIPAVFGEDDEYLPDRAGRFRRPSKVYTGWPPASLAGEIDDDDDDDDETREDKPKKKKRRRKKKSSGGESKTAEPSSDGEGATEAKASGDDAAVAAEGEDPPKKKKRRRRRKKKPAAVDGAQAAEGGGTPDAEGGAPEVADAAAE